MTRTPARGWAAPWRRTVALLISVAILFGLLWSAPASEAAPQFNGKLCRDVYKIKNPSNRNELPSAEEIAELGELVVEYTNPAEPVRTTKYPTDADGEPISAAQLLKKYGTDYGSADVGTDDHLFRRFNAHRQSRGSKALPFDRYLISYLTVFDNKARGDAFEKFMVTQFGLGNDHWFCQVTFDSNGKKLRVDLYNSQTNKIHELKAGDKAIYKQLRNYRALAEKIGAKPGNVAFGLNPRQSMINGVNKTGFTATPLRTTQVLTNVTQPPRGGTFNPNLNSPNSGGAADRMAQGSGRTPTEARRMEENYRTLGGQKLLNQGIPRPGGVDWTSLDLRYLSENEDGEVNYAFDAAENADPDESASYGGEEAMKLSSDAFFTWLALPDDSFWVDLDPDNPDEIMDDSLGRTDAGRVLLQADLKMKRLAQNKDGLIDPATPTGQALWDGLHPNPDGKTCWPMHRVWITPKPAVVRQKGGELHFVDAPLDVNAERVTVDETPSGSCEAVASEETLDANIAVYKKTIIAELEKQVNSTSEFADLRRVYMSRVAAAWVKDRNASKPGAYDKIIDSGKINRWETQTDWTPQEEYAAFVKDTKTVQYTVERNGEQNGVPYSWIYPIYGAWT